MKNKILIKISIPQLNTSYDVFLPTNELIWRIKKLLVKSISDLNGIELKSSLEYILINKDNTKIYSNNELVINTDIRNGSELLLISR